MRETGVVVFDVDGTLIKETCWEIVHRHFNVDWKKTEKNIEDYVNGKISFQKLTKKEIELWKKCGEMPHIDEVNKALQNYTLVKNAKETVDKLKQKGYIPILVTYGLDILAYKIADQLNVDSVFANKLKINKKGLLTGGQINRVKLGRKSEILREISAKLDIPLSRFIVIGDSKYDLDMFKDVGLRIALNPKDEEIRKAADIVLETEDLADLIKNLSS